MNESTFVSKEACPKCGSKDNLARYSDGHAHCFGFGCDYFEQATDEAQTTKRKQKMAAGLITGGEYKALPARAITEETCRKFGYTVTKLEDGRTVQVAPYTDADGNVVAQKIRPKSKDDMFVAGKLKGALLFGQHLWGSGGKKVVITEGELDAMSVSQVQGHKWPVVSVPNGADGAAQALAKQLQWLCTFDEVVLMFDQDEPHYKRDGTPYFPGQQAAVECAKLFPPGKCKIAVLPLKDANECLKEGKGDQIVSAIWQAKPYRPDGLVTIADIRERVLKEPETGLAWFMPTLTKLTYGRRLGEVYAFGAGTGIGKTDLFTQQMQYDTTTLGEKVGVFSLEQDPAETVKRIAGKFAKRCFHIPDGSWTTEELTNSLDLLEESGKVFLYDSWGATDWETIKGLIRFLAHSEGVRLFYLDHLTALVAEDEDENAALKKLMAAMAKLAKELQIIIHFISHLSTPEGKPHEEGGRVMIRHFRGSRTIGYWSHFMFALERDQQSEDKALRSITTFRVLKDRNTGRAAGEVFYLGYDPQGGLLYETEAPKENTSKFRDETEDDEVPF